MVERQQEAAISVESTRRWEVMQQSLSKTTSSVMKAMADEKCKEREVRTIILSY